MCEVRTFVQDHLVAEDFNFNGAACALDQSGEDLAHGLTACLDVHGADAQDDGLWRRLDIPGSGEGRWSRAPEKHIPWVGGEGEVRVRTCGGG